jgi:hypothetical protein
MGSLESGHMSAGDPQNYPPDIFGQLQSIVGALKEYMRALLLLNVWYFQDIVAEFNGKHFSFLWRGSGDSFY